MKNALFNWSGGKDSSFALHQVLLHKEYSVNCLLTSISEKHDRVSMHGVKVSLLRNQANSVGIPLTELLVPESPSMEVYNKCIEERLAELKLQGITHSIFGDIFLEDLRKYREKQLEQIGLKAVFPLWNKNTLELAHAFIDAGFKAIITCVNEKYLDASFAGRIIDKQFLEDIPGNVDPCGENGEYHSFVFDGPIFKHPVKFSIGEKVFKQYKSPDNNTQPSDTGYWFCDLNEV